MTSINRSSEKSTAQGLNLGLATLAFATTFWAWNMIAPLGVRYTEQLGLTSSEKSLLVAIPVLVGSLGRIVTGALTDRYGGRLMFTVLCFVSIAPVLAVARRPRSYSARTAAMTAMSRCRASFAWISGSTRSRNAVDRRPARKSGWATMRSSTGIVVLTPTILYSDSARAIRFAESSCQRAVCDRLAAFEF